MILPFTRGYPLLTPLSPWAAPVSGRRTVAATRASFGRPADAKVRPCGDIPTVCFTYLSPRAIPRIVWLNWRGRYDDCGHGSRNGSRACGRSYRPAGRWEGSEHHRFQAAPNRQVAALDRSAGLGVASCAAGACVFPNMVLRNGLSWNIGRRIRARAASSG